MGVAANSRRKIPSEWEASAIASEMKEYAKREPGSVYEIDTGTMKILRTWKGASRGWHLTLR